MVTHDDGAYLINWSYEGSEPKNSTFFPADWTPEQVVEAIKEGLQNIKSIELENGKYQIKGETKARMKILYIGKIVTDTVDKSSFLKY
ncbi:MAG: EndoU domain-containing protein [Candidatus Dependentiae bacterium]